MHVPACVIGGGMKAPDENDKLQANRLSADPETGTKPIAPVVDMKKDDVARVLTVRQILEAAATRATSASKESACTTGHYGLDFATGGIRPGHGWVFAAETNWGKSSWLVAVADENIRRGKRVLIVSTEDDESIYGNRLLTRRSQVAASRIRSGNLWNEDRESIAATVENAEQLPVFLDARGKTAEWTAKHVDRLIVSENIDLVAFDYLQEFSAARQQENHRLTVKYVAGVLRKVVKLRGKASIIFSQVTIDAQVKRAYPDRNMIRDCRDVANAAEVILIGYVPEKAVENAKGEVIVPGGAKAIFVDKVKDGPKGFAVWAEWDDDTASFLKVERRLSAEERAAKEASDSFDGDFQDGETLAPADFQDPDESDRRHP
jgi:replicative DNA helicase